MENRGIVQQMKDWNSKPPTEYNKITKEDIISIQSYLFGREIKYTKDLVFEQEDVETAINHFKFVTKYNLCG